MLCWLGALALVICLAPGAAWAAPAAQAVPCAVEYTVQAGDWLSSLAGRYLDDPQLYPAIVEATNRRHETDSRFAHIAHPDVIEVGWLLCVPTAAMVYWRPLPPAECQALADGLAQQLKVPAMLTTTSFYTDALAGPWGFGCQITASGTNQVFQARDATDIAQAVDSVLSARGWSLDEESRFGAEAFTYYSDSHRQTNGLCLLQVEAHLSPDASCFPDEGFVNCFYRLKPEQQLYGVQLSCASHL
jgi:hypothetical protein